MITQLYYIRKMVQCVHTFVHFSVHSTIDTQQNLSTQDFDFILKRISRCVPGSGGTGTGPGGPEPGTKMNSRSKLKY